jgi:hypothetical protein
MNLDCKRLRVGRLRQTGGEEVLVQVARRL